MQQITALSQAYLVIHFGNRWTDILRLQPEQPVIVGRSSENQIVVRDDRVSRRHAQISHQDGGWTVADLGSRNGTQLSGRFIESPQPLRVGDTIVVGGCHILFTDSLSSAFSNRGEPARRAGDLYEPSLTVQVHLDQAPPHPGTPRPGEAGQESLSGSVQDPNIVNRLARSQWSAELDPGDFSELTTTDKWSFFYRLVFDLVTSTTPEQAAGIALDRLLGELGVSSGGVVLLSQTSSSGRRTGPVDQEIKLAVIAARQAAGRSYHRISDTLVRSVLQDQQAVLARNISHDDQLAMGGRSGQASTTSILCAPLRCGTDPNNQSIIGLLHVYSLDNERMLSADDLHVTFGVAENLSIALQQLESKQQLSSELDRSRRKVSQLQEELEQFHELIGTSSAMERVRQEIRRAAPSMATVLIRGESGAGKELVARAIHHASSRSDGPMVCLNCAALAPSLLESELFGHEKGAFTGATERKIGKFEAANGGTLLLDEVGEMPHELQAKFLRVLEGHPFERLGGNTPIQPDVRVIAATNRDLEEAVRARQFRSDLYFRLRVVEIVVPPLRQRLEDLPELVEHFVNLLKQHAHRKLLGIEPAAMELLARHSWPGNVRELRNIIERAIVLGSGDTIGPSDLNLSPIHASMDGNNSVNTPPELETLFHPQTIDELEKAHILATLEHVHGNKSKAAQLLGIERSTLDRKLKRY